MILPISLLLVSLLSFTHCIEPPHIDLERCKSPNPENFCLVRGSCAQSAQGSSTDKIVYFNGFSLKDDTCDVIVQIKPYSESKWHVMMQVNGTYSNENLAVEGGIDFIHSESQFSCSSNGVKSDPKFTLEKDKARAIMNKELIFCSLLLTSKDNVPMKKIFKDDLYDDKAPTVRYSSSIGEEEQPTEHNLKYSIGGNILWGSVLINCNPDDISTSEAFQWPWILSKVDITRLRITCSSKEQLIIIYKRDLQLAKDLKCESAKYKFETTNNETVTIDQNEKFEAYCGVDAQAFCTPLTFNINCPGCTPNISSYSCPSNKWRWKDGSVVTSITNCTTTNSNWTQFGYFLTVGGKQKEITEGVCSDKFDCAAFSNLKFECADDRCKRPFQSPDNKTINCTAEYNLRFLDKTVASLKCNERDGLYYDGQTSVPRGSTVFCEEVVSAIPSAQSGLSAATLAGIAIAALVIVTLIILAIVLILRRRRAKNTQPTLTSTTNNDDVKTAKRYDSKEHRSNPSNPVSENGSTAPASTEKEKQSKGSRESAKEKKNEEEKQKETAKELPEETSKAPSKKETAKPDTKKVDDVWSKPKKHERLVLDRSEMNKYMAYTRQLPGHPVKRATMNTVSEFQRKQEVVPGETRLNKWNDNMFFMEILMVFHRYSLENRIKCLDSLTTFQHYSKESPEPNFGTMKQLFQIVQYSQSHGMRCHDTWERIFRVVKILREIVPKDDKLDIAGRMAAAIKDIGVNNIEKYGYARKKDEPPSESLMRMVGVRMALWGEDDSCLEQIKKFGALKPAQVESPLRMAVFSYAVNNMGKEKELKELFYEELKKNKTEHPKKYPLGTMRQHLLFALCSARNRNNKDGEFATLKEIMAVVNETDKAKRLADFSPTDLLYAYRGATEDRATWPTALELFQKYVPADVEETIEPLVEELCKKPDEKKKLTDAFKQDFMDLCTLMADNAANEKDSRVVMDTCSAYIFYVAKPGVRTLDPGRYNKRAANLQELAKTKDRGDLMHDALIKCRF